MLQVSAGVQLVAYALEVGGVLSAVTVLSGALARSRERGAAAAVAIGLAVWFAIASAVAEVGFLGGGQVAPTFESFGLRVAAPLAIGAVAIALFEPLRRLLSDPDVQPALIAVQTYRVVGGVFLVLLALGALPALFAISAGAGDVLIGLTAVAAARSIRGGQVGRAVLWNALGLLDLVVAVGLGVTLQLVATTPGTAPLTVLPLVLVPTFAVPLSILLHVVSLRSLLGTRAAVRALS